MHIPLQKIVEHQNFVGYAVDASLVLFSIKSGRVYGLDGLSAALFLDVYEECLISEMDTIFNRFSNIPQPFIRQIYQILYNQEGDENEQYSPPLPYARHHTDDAVREGYRVNDTIFLIHYPDPAIRSWIHPNLEHLKSELAVDIPSVYVDFNGSDDSWEVLFNQSVVSTEAVVLERLALSLHELMMIAAYQARPYLIAIHAAAMKRGNEVIVLPGSSGSGKTTLTAALLKHGFELFSDEVGLIDHNGNCLPLGMAMPIKEGSWSVIQNDLGMRMLPGSNTRWDGQKVRFLIPDRIALSPQKLSHIIFPKYQQSREPKVQKISASECMMQIKSAGYQLDRPLDEETFERILSFVATLPAYQIEYSSTKQALEAIEKILCE